MWQRIGGTATCLVSAIVLTFVFVSEAAAAPCTAPKRYTLIVANNATNDPSVPQLQYADDDAIRYQELFRAAGARVALLVTLDQDTRERFPLAVQTEIPPTRQNVIATAKSLFARVQAELEEGCDSHFYFIYTGHGDVDPNRQGYINLSDGPFHRSDLYEEIVERSTATFNHLIIDSCHAASFIQRKGDRTGNFRGPVEDFVSAEDWADYDNTGFIYAGSDGGQALESARWEAGVFSHQMRSALLGPGDVDLDGHVTYAETAAFIGAANAAVREKWAHLKVYYRPPVIRETVSLLDVADYRGVAWLTVDPAHAGRYWIDDDDGRVADLHSSAEQPVRLALVGKPPFQVSKSNLTADLPRRNAIEVRDLVFGPATIGFRGYPEYFRMPFGIGRYRSIIGVQGH